jgi:hypothetical protein
MAGGSCRPILLDPTPVARSWDTAAGCFLRQVATSLSRAATASRSRGAFRPRFAVNFLNPPFRGRRECRAPDAPAAACAMIVVERTRVSQVTPESPGIPRAMVLTASFVLSPATGLSCHRNLRDLTAGLTPASGCQDHTTSPSASKRPRQERRPRPPHPIPTFVAMANAPCVRKICQNVRTGGSRKTARRWN